MFYICGIICRMTNFDIFLPFAVRQMSKPILHVNASSYCDIGGARHAERSEPKAESVLSEPHYDGKTYDEHMLTMPKFSGI